MKYTKDQIEAAINGKRNATARNIRLMAGGCELALSQGQLAYIRATGIEPKLVGYGQQVNVHPGFRPVYRGSSKNIYAIEMA